jgi:hypothetical protein
MKKILFIIVILLLLPSVNYARSWNDLDENETKIFGSEKEKKYSINAFIIEKEKWKDHSSFMMFWLFKTTDYTKYKSLRILPFYYNLKSKIDNRESTFIPIFLHYTERDRDNIFTMNPVYYSNTYSNEKTKSILYLFWWGSNKYNKESYILNPLFYSNVYNKGTNQQRRTSFSWIHYHESNENRKSYTWWAPIIPLIYHKARQKYDVWNLFWVLGWENREDTGFRDFYFFPFFSYDDQSYSKTKNTTSYSWLHYYSKYKTDNHYKTSFWAPIIPIIYYYSSTSKKHINLFWIFDYERDKKEKLVRRLMFLPFFYHDDDSNKKNNYVNKMTITPFYYNSEYKSNYKSETTWWFPILPLVYKNKTKLFSHLNILLLYDHLSKKGEETRRHMLLPIFYHENNSIKKNNYVNKFNLSFLHYYSKYKAEQRSETTFWAPIIPIFYYNKTKSYKHINVLYGFDYKTNNVNGLRRLMFLPFFYIQNDSIKKENYTDKMNLSLFHYYSKYKSGDKSETIFWVPIIPIYYSSKSNNSSAFHFFPFYFNYKDKSNSTIFGPFYYFNKTPHDKSSLTFNVWNYKTLDNNQKSFHILPLYYSYNKKSKNTDYSQDLFLPFYYKTSYKFEDKKNNRLHKDFQLSSLLFHYSSSKTQDGEKIDIAKKLFIPILPIIFYSNEDSTGITRNFLLFNWKTSKKTHNGHFWLMPLFFHQTKTNGYRYYIPFYFRSKGWSESNGLSFGLFPIQYHKWTPNEEIEWYSFLYYNRENKITKDEVTHLMPIYWSFKYKTWSLSTFLPFYVKYKDKKGSIFVTLSGYSQGIDIGVNENLPSNKKGWYLDTDFRFMYNLVSISTRITLSKKIDMDDAENIDKTTDTTDTSELQVNKKHSIEEKIVKTDTNDLKRDEKSPIKKKIKTTTDPPVKPDNNLTNNDTIKTINKTDGEPTVKINETKPAFSDKKEFGRDNSISFWGFQLLFGILAYEKADTKRHFRLLPFSWITWDNKSKDKIKWIINYISYKSEKDDFEYMVFFPFYGHQREGKSYRKGYGLIGYWDEYDDNLKLKEKTLLWPIFNYYSSPAKSGWRIFPIVWHNTRTTDEYKVSRTISPIYYSSSKIYKDKTIKSNLFSISPFHIRYMDKNISSYWIPILPLMYIGNGNDYFHFNLLGFINYKNDKIQKKKEKWIFPIIYSYEDAKSSDWNLFLGLYNNYFNKKSKKSYNSLLWSIVKWSSTEKSSSFRFIPFLWMNKKSYSNKIYRTSYSILFPFYNSTVEDRATKKTISRTTITLPYYYSNSIKERTFWFPIIPLIYYNSDSRSRPGIRSSTTITPLFYHNRDVEVATKNTKFMRTISPLYYFHKNSINNKTFWFPIIPLTYYHSTNYSWHLNILGLFDISRNSNTKKSNTAFYPFIIWKSGPTGYKWLFPFFYKSWDDSIGYTNSLVFNFYKSHNRLKKERAWHFIPFYFSWNREDASSKFILGLYLHRSKTYKRTNFLYLYDREEYKLEKRIQNRFLLGTIDQESSIKYNRLKLFYGLLSSWTNYKDSPSYKFTALGPLYEVSRINYNTSWDFKHYLFPAWYYSSRSNGSYSLIIPPLLTYYSKDPRGNKFQLVMLGAAWYRSFKPERSYDLQALVLGIPYYKIKRPERGYQSRGSLWGILWEEQRESETGYYKLSILKFLFKHVEVDGKSYNSILGFKF